MANQLYAARYYCGRFRTIVDNNHQRASGKMLHVLFECSF
ncbi:Uncharacterised protein [Enterobacter hormaechei]|nr:Uncharacterised protein [Enterobacter hormaechei]CZX26765.1 Uncharacterised protein [Enterobacter hormaechei]CZX43016.1 Uncharacterised protein [Enterobacter hormaechei]CZZ42346.1 Uncharacterised protein [Enterobacter hormaechei]SAC35862.1 Uncharacterised protein [Enterobacter hormaechei]